jgi:hypothetical protein
LVAPGGMRTSMRSRSSVSRIWQASREVEQILLLLAGRGKPLELLGIDDHVAGRAGHHAFARSFERLALGPGDVEQPLAGRRFHFLVEGSVRPEKPHQGHASNFSCARAAASIRWSASTSSASLV